MICPKCGKSILKKEIIEKEEKKKQEKKKKKSKTNNKDEIEIEEQQPNLSESLSISSEIASTSVSLSSKLKGKVKVKEKLEEEVKLENDKIELKKGEYIKLFGIVSSNRVPLYCSNGKYIYLLELTNNLDFIATSILGGVLDKMLLVSENGENEKCQWYTKDNVIYLVYGVFPDKKGKWLLEQIAKQFTDLMIGKDLEKLEKIDKYQFEAKFNPFLKFLLEEYLKMQEIFSDQDIPYVENKIRIDYFGLSSKSIGVISLILGNELQVQVPGTYTDPNEELEMKESILTAKIEALAANTVGNTRAMPKWIAVKLGFQNYRFLTFKRYQNDYFSYFLSEGNLGKTVKAEDEIDPYINHVVDTPFSGNLKSINRLKTSLKEFFNNKRVFS